MSAAQGGDVVAAGWPTMVVGDAVVVVAGGGGSGAPGMDAGAVAFGDLVVESVGDFVLVDPDVLVEVDDLADGHLGVGVGAPALDLLHRDRRAGGVAAAGVLVAQVDVDVHLPRLDQRPGTAVVGVEQVAEVVAGDHPDRLGAADVEGVGGTRRFELFGGLGDSGLEIQTVGGVQHGVRVHGAVPAGPVEVNLDLPVLRGRDAAFLGLVGVEGVPGVLAQLLGGRHADLVRHRGQPTVHVRGTLGREQHRVLGDPPGPPERQSAVHDEFPDSLQPVPDLEHLPDMATAGIDRHPQCGGELDHRELRHERRTRPVSGRPVSWPNSTIVAASASST